MSDDEALEIPVSDCPAVVYRNEYYSVPQPIADAAVLLLNTEGHEDPVVRALRKAAVQTLSALNQLMQGDDDLVVSETEKILDNARIVSISPVPEGQGFPGSSIIVENDEDRQARIIREAARVGVTIPPREQETFLKTKVLTDEERASVMEVNPQRVRKWAAEHGIEVSDRGRIPAHVIIAYKEAAGL